MFDHHQYHFKLIIRVKNVKIPTAISFQYNIVCVAIIRCYAKFHHKYSLEIIIKWSQFNNLSLNNTCDMIETNKNVDKIKKFYPAFWGLHQLWNWLYRYVYHHDFWNWNWLYFYHYDHHDCIRIITTITTVYDPSRPSQLYTNHHDCIRTITTITTVYDPSRLYTNHQFKGQWHVFYRIIFLFKSNSKEWYTLIPFIFS